MPCISAPLRTVRLANEAPFTRSWPCPDEIDAQQRGRPRGDCARGDLPHCSGLRLDRCAGAPTRQHAAYWSAPAAARTGDLAALYSTTDHAWIVIGRIVHDARRSQRDQKWWTYIQVAPRAPALGLRRGPAYRRARGLEEQDAQADGRTPRGDQASRGRRVSASDAHPMRPAGQGPAAGMAQAASARSAWRRAGSARSEHECVLAMEIGEVLVKRCKARLAQTLTTSRSAAPARSACAPRPATRAIPTLCWLTARANAPSCCLRSSSTRSRSANQARSWLAGSRRCPVTLMARVRRGGGGWGGG